MASHRPEPRQPATIGDMFWSAVDQMPAGLFNFIIQFDKHEIATNRKHFLIVKIGFC